MEILPLEPVMLIDTAGIDDVGELGELRVERTMQVLNKTDLAVLVLDPSVGVTDFDRNLKELISKRGIPTVVVVSKWDEKHAVIGDLRKWEEQLELPVLPVSAKTTYNMEELKKVLIQKAPVDWEGTPIIGDLLEKGDVVVLVVPIDTAAPKGSIDFATGANHS